MEDNPSELLEVNRLKFINLGNELNFLSPDQLVRVKQNYLDL
jgi:hypothetical protein